MKHIGSVGDKIQVQVKLVRSYEFMTYYTYRGELNHIYTMETAEGDVIVWKTSSELGYDVVRPNKADPSQTDYGWLSIKKGDVFTIKATVKKHGEYKGELQTEVQRVKVVEVVETAPTKEELEEKKRNEQLATLKGGDFTWRMPYAQYKAHYADCETIAGSYKVEEDGVPTITVIVREGRLKASGVRGRHFAYYCLKNSDGVYRTYYAVDSENAYKKAEKEFPNSGWELHNITPTGIKNYW